MDFYILYHLIILYGTRYQVSSNKHDQHDLRSAGVWLKNINAFPENVIGLIPKTQSLWSERMLHQARAGGSDVANGAWGKSIWHQQQLESSYARLVQKRLWVLATEAPQNYKNGESKIGDPQVKLAFHGWWEQMHAQTWAWPHQWSLVPSRSAWVSGAKRSKMEL